MRKQRVGAKNEGGTGGEGKDRHTGRVAGSDKSALPTAAQGGIKDRMMTMKERMTNGLLYRVDDEIFAAVMRSRKLVRLFNTTTEEQGDYRKQLLKALFGATGENLYIEPTFRCDIGSNISVGNNFLANFDCIILDVCPVTIGENVLFGPRVGVYTPMHPMDAAGRATMVEYGKPVSIGDNVWIGGSVVINGGVTIGSNTVIGSGSVVTKAIPAGVFAAGNPCRVIREINAEDTARWEQEKAKFDQYLRQSKSAATGLPLPLGG